MATASPCAAIYDASFAVNIKMRKTSYLTVEGIEPRSLARECPRLGRESSYKKLAGRLHLGRLEDQSVISSQQTAFST